MELLQLKYFLELATEQHLTRVAEKLYVSPSAISSSIARLESELEVKLFNRVGRRIELNEYGQLYLPYVKQALETLNDGQNHIKDLTSSQSTFLSLVMANPYLWQNALDGFSKTYPNIQFACTLFDPLVVGRKLPNQNVNLIIASPSPLGFNSPDWDYTTLFKDRVGLAVHPEHPFAMRESISLSEAKDEWFVSLSDSTFSQFTLELCHTAGFTPKSRITCDYMLRPDIAFKENMVALTTFHTVKAGLFSKMVVVPLSDENAVRPQAIFYPKKRYLAKPARLLIDFLIEYYKDYDSLS